MKTNRTSTKAILTLSAAFAVLMVFGFSSDAFAFSLGHHGHHGGHHGGGHHGGHHGAHGHRRHGCHRPHFGLGFRVAPRPSGHYQTVTETVMVEPQRVEKYWVPAEFKTVTNPSTGAVTTVKVRDGYMAERVIPARYQTVTRQVWVPSSSPSVGIGFGFRF